MDKQFAKKILQEQFPKQNKKLLGEGYDNWVYEVKNEMLVRIPKTPLYRKKLLQEIKLLELLEPSSPFPIPKYELIAVDGTFGLYKKIKGSALTPAVFKKLSTKNQASIASKLGKFISLLHSLPNKKLKILGYKTVATKNQKLEYKKRHKTIHSLLSREESHLVDALQNQYFKMPKPNKLKLVHHDLSDEHILLAPNKREVAGIIDFTDASFDDPAVDFAWLWELGENFVYQVYRNYQFHDQTFIERSSRYWFQNILSQLFYTTQKHQKKAQSEALGHLKKFLHRAVHG